MQFDKSMLIDLLRQQGQGDRADEAERELPARVDTDDEGQLGILRKLGIDPDMITSLLDKLPPGLAGKVPEGLKDKLPGGLGKLL
jgi:hypothetical protein